MRVLRVFSKDQKDRAVRRIEAGETVRSVSEGTGILRNSRYQWLDAHRRMGPGWLEVKRGRKRSAGDFGARASAGPPSAAVDPSAARAPDDPAAAAKVRIAELERLVGRQQVELDFFQEALRSWDATSRSGGAPISSPSSKR
jgi:transposase-like protein